jgi:hypothetical protein
MAHSLPPAGETETAAADPAYGSGHFGRWSQDEFGAPSFVYTANQTTDPRAVTDVQAGILGPTEHVHQIGNDRITALASNFGTVRVRQDEDCPKLLNDVDAEMHQFGGGLGYLTDGAETLSTWYDGTQANFERTFGMGYFRKRVASQGYGVDQVIFAPFGDDPVLLTQVTITNRGSAPASLRWVEYWGCQPYQLSFRALIEAGSDNARAHKLRRELGRRFEHEITVLPGNHGLIDKKSFTSRSPEEEAAWQRAHHGSPFGFITPVQPLRPGTDYETTRIPDAFLVSLDGPATATSSDAESFFGAGGPGRPDGQSLPLAAGTGKPSAMLVERSFELAPGASRTLYFLYGYLAESFTLDALVAKYTPAAANSLRQTVETWQRTGMRFEVAGQPWIRRESVWNHYYLRSALSYDDYFGEHILNQNGYYQYTMGFQGAPRDPLQHALPFLFSNPEITKGVLRYTLKEVRDDGSLPYAIVGHGVVAPMLSDRASDLPLWLLWAVSEYVLATRDTDFLGERISAGLSAEPGKSDTVANLLRRCFQHQLRDVGVGKHGLSRMLVDDWNDGLIYTWAYSDMKDCIETSESVLNAVMSAWVFDYYARLLRFSGDSSGLAPQAVATAGEYRKAVAAQWNGKWFKRVWLGEKLGWLGDSTLWIEPQPWAILSGAATPDQTSTLVRSIDSQLRQGPLGARQMSEGPDMRSTKAAERGTLEMGAIWPSLNQTLVWALAGVNPAMAWEEWKRNTLAHHAEAYPGLWYGVWSGNDSWNSPLNTNPGGAANQQYFHGTDFPVLNPHSHACSLYSATKLLGLEFTESGLKLNLSLPEREYRLDSPLVGVSRSGARFEGWYKPSHPGRWTILVALPKDAPTPMQLRINGKTATVRRTADGSFQITGASTPNEPLRWALA